MAAPSKVPWSFYGWRVVAVVFGTNFLATGTGFYAFNAFMLPLCQANGWTRAELNVAPMLGFFCGLVGQFAYGTLLGRIGPRQLMSLGPILSCAAFAAMGQVHSLPWFFFFYCLLMIGNGTMGGLVASAVVSNWFEAGRGRALGLATVGISVSGVILPPVAAALLGSIGLGGAFAAIGGLILLSAPVSWLVVRDTPESMGLEPDGGVAPGPDNGENDTTAGAETLWSPRRLAASPVFWRLGLAYGLAMIGIMGVLFQLGPHFEDQGWPVGTALALVSLTAFAGAVGKYCWSALCDRTHPLKVVAWMLVVNAAGLGLGLLAHSAVGAAAFALIFGFSMGGVMSTYPTVTAHLFGRASFALVYRFLVMFTLLQVFGYLAMGQSFALSGSYDLAFVVFLLLDLGAAALVFSLVGKKTAAAS